VYGRSIHRTLGIAALAIALTGCLEAGTPGALGSVADTLGQDTTTQDTRPPDDDTAAATDTRTCLPGELTITTGILEDASTPWAVRVSEPGRVAFSLGTYPTAPANVYTWRPTSGEPAEVLPAPPGASVIDGRGGAVLLDHPADDDAWQQRGLLYTDGVDKVDLTDPDERLWQVGRFDRAFHLVDDGQVAFLSCVYDGQGACIKMKLRSWTRGEGDVRTLWVGTGGGVPPTAPFVTEDAVLWAERVDAVDGPWQIRELRDGEVATLLTVDGPVQEIVAHTGGALWTTPEAVYYAKPGGEPRKLRDGGCLDVDSDGTLAAMVCAEGPPPGDVWLPTVFAQWGRLWLYAGGDDLRPVTAEPAIVGYPRVDRGLVAWLELPVTATNDCFERGPARVRVASTRAPSPVTVAETDTTCFCCAAIWPPHALSLGCGLLAWTYAPSGAEPTDPPWNSGRLGWAQVTTCD